MTAVTLALRVFPPSCSPPADVVLRFCRPSLSYQVRGHWWLTEIPAARGWRRLLASDLYLRN